MKHIGMTGTRAGLSEFQQETLQALMRAEDEATLHHGDCVGADAEAHKMAAQLNWTIVVHPPLDPRNQAFCAGDDIREPKSYRDRNIDIVKESEVLWAFPEGAEADFPRSGSWMTVRIALKNSVPVVVIRP